MVNVITSSFSDSLSSQNTYKQVKAETNFVIN